MQSSGDRNKVNTARWNACALCKACAELYPRMGLALLQLLLIGVHRPYLEIITRYWYWLPIQGFLLQSRAERKDLRRTCRLVGYVCRAGSQEEPILLILCEPSLLPTAETDDLHGETFHRTHLLIF